MNHKTLWNKILVELKNSQPKHAYSTWFVPIRSIALNNDTLLLELPNQFFYEWIQSHYKQAIEQASNAVSKKELEIKFTVSPEAPTLKTSNAGLLGQEGTPEKKASHKPKTLNEQYTLSSFIQGAHNEFAKAAAKNVTENPGDQSFNPLVIYGGVCMGKTHLLHAIGNVLLEKNPMMKVVCASSEKFTLDFISSIQKNKTVEFSKSYRNADVLLIDDIQFFQGKEQTQEQFFHTFNELFQSNKQIVMTADRYPGEMSGLQDRLLSRFKSGLSVDIQPPDFETRVAIVMEKAEQNGLKLSYDIIE